jgi:hypothetical protein
MITKYLKLYKLFYLSLIATVHGSVKGIQENVILATGVNPNKLENNKKLHSDLMTHIAKDMAVNTCVRWPFKI